MVGHLMPWAPIQCRQPFLWRYVSQKVNNAQGLFSICLHPFCNFYCSSSQLFYFCFNL
ncbi:hypothetical protein GW17_00031199 [Ensete ventricosum]|nr:hypothetical protein GW17_00031199 [Ensete ventricosum]RZR78304.1 hypothetical protein BHM03_00003577 [Ensete ventricosum]